MICLCDREADRVVVKLWEQYGEITVTVRDDKTGEHFVLKPSPDKALDAFYHPFAYRKGKETTDCTTVDFYNNSDSD